VIVTSYQKPKKTIFGDISPAALPHLSPSSQSASSTTLSTHPINNYPVLRSPQMPTGAAPGTSIGQRLTNALAYAGWTETTVLHEELENFDAELLQEEESEAKAEAEKGRPGLTMFTDGSRLDDGATGYAVVWKSGQTWKGIKTHMGYKQEAYDAECAAFARALEEASRRNLTPERVTIFTDAQAAIRRMVSDEPGPGQQYALQARKHIAPLC